MTSTSKRLGAMLLGCALLGLALTMPAGSTSAGDRVAYGKGDFATIGSSPQFLTEAELKKFDAARAFVGGAGSGPGDRGWSGAREARWIFDRDSGGGSDGSPLPTQAEPAGPVGADPTAPEARRTRLPQRNRPANRARRG
jgi:hypothetical protein